MARFQSRRGGSGKPGDQISLDLNIWRVIGAELCTLIQAQTVYNYADLLDMHEFLNYREYLEDVEIRKAEQKAAKK